MEKEENSNDQRGLNILFHGVYILFILSFLFFYLVSSRTKYDNLIIFGAISLIIILPIIWAKMKLWIRIPFSVILFIVLSIVLSRLNYIKSMELGVFIFFIFLFVFSLIIVVISHFILRWSLKSFNKSAKKIIISIMIILMALLVILSVYNIYTQYIEYKNNFNLQDIQCKGAYTTTSSEEFRNLCDEINPYSNYWSLVKSHCLEVADKISLDRYYFDATQENINKGIILRWPENYIECAKYKYTFLESNYISPNYSGVILPQVKDPNLCEYYETIYFQGGGKTTEQCYESIAIATNDSSLCEKADGTWCYEEIAMRTGNPSLCEKVGTTPAQHDPCYSGVAVAQDDASICEYISDLGRIEDCKKKTLS